MAGHDIIPAIMLGMTLVGVIAALLCRGRIVVATAGINLVLFVVSFWFPDPVTEQTRRLHWFPASLAVLLVQAVLLPAATLIGYLGRAIYRKVGTGRMADADAR